MDGYSQGLVGRVRNHIAGSLNDSISVRTFEAAVALSEGVEPIDGNVCMHC